MNKLFIYGTLAPGKQNHGILKDIPGQWVAATVKGKIFDEGWGSELGCPGMIPSDEGDEIKGFLFTSDQLAQHWPMLDEFEGAEYMRMPVSVKYNNDEEVDAFVYALRRKI